jgi:mannose-1-phosphate guanylyltransferase
VGERSLSKETNKLKAVILAGGLGTRLRPFTLLLPKPMLPVGPKPILEHIIEWLKANGIKNIVVSTGYLGRMIEEYFRNGSELGVNIEYARSNRPLGIAGQLRAVNEKVDGRFLCLYGDAILDFRLEPFIDFHLRKKALVTMALMKYETKLKYGLIDTDKSGRISSWREKPVIGGDINIGCYMMEKRFLKYIPVGKVYGMKEAIEASMQEGETICAVSVKGKFIDIGDRKSYMEANELFLKEYGKIP